MPLCWPRWIANNGVLTRFRVALEDNAVSNEAAGLAAPQRDFWRFWNNFMFFYEFVIFFKIFIEIKLKFKKMLNLKLLHFVSNKVFPITGKYGMFEKLLLVFRTPLFPSTIFFPAIIEENNNNKNVYRAGTNDSKNEWWQDENFPTLSQRQDWSFLLYSVLHKKRVHKRET